jgi:Flp pilus assembly protein TadG
MFEAYPLPWGLKPVFSHGLIAARQRRSTEKLVPVAGFRKEQIPPVGRDDKRNLKGPGAQFSFGAEGGATLAEFAFTLPILVLILYGIFDFGSALVLKQKLEHVTYEASRAAASQSTDDLSNPAVATAGSVADLRDTVAQNLQNAGVNDCGLLGAAPSSSNAVTATWVYNVSGGGCPAALVLTIRRQSVASVGGVSVVYSRVTLQYPYQYHVVGILKVVAPGSTFPTSANLLVNSTMKNLI